MKKTSLYEYIAETADASLNLMNKTKGCFPAGKNGPHSHSETPVRNTSHWLITLAKAFKITQDEKYFNAVINSANYLLNDKLRPNNYTFIHRNSKNRDKCNGLIGQAWTIEALVEAYELLDCKDCKRLAKEIFLMHPFNWDIGLWRRREIDGTTWRGIDLTLNHQIFFAAAGSLLDKEQKSEISTRIIRFLDCLSNNIQLSNQDCFEMSVYWKPLLLTGFPFEAFRVTSIYTNLRSKRKKKDKEEVKVGYHAFHLYGLAILKTIFPKHKLWRSIKIKRSLDYLFEKDYYNKVFKSKYGIGYNPPGFEVAFAIFTFKDVYKVPYNISEILSFWVSEQLTRTYNHREKMMNKVKYDPVTYAARIYEATRLPNITIKTQDEDKIFFS